METAISAGVTAPMARPMGAWIAASFSASYPSSFKSFISPATRRREPIMPRYDGIAPERICRRQSASQRWPRVMTQT